MASVEAWLHPDQRHILLSRERGRVFLVDFSEARELIEQMLLILARHDQANRLEVPR